MAIVKLFNLSDKVQVLVRKYDCEEDDSPSFSIETIIDHEDAVVSCSMNHKYKDEITRDNMFENKVDLSMITHIENSAINLVLDETVAQQLLINNEQ